MKINIVLMYRLISRYRVHIFYAQERADFIKGLERYSPNAETFSVVYKGDSGLCATVLTKLDSAISFLNDMLKAHRVLSCEQGARFRYELTIIDFLFNNLIHPQDPIESFRG